MKSRVCESYVMTVGAFFERFPQYSDFFSEVRSRFADDDTVRISFRGRKIIVDFLAFTK